MVFTGIRPTLAIAAALLALAAWAAAPNAAAAQATASGEREQQLLEKIQNILSRDGPYAPELLEPLTALIVLYEEEQDDALAAVTIERARQVVRINKGLHTLEQLPYLRQLMRVEKARGNDGEAWDLEQELLALVRRHPEDLRTVPVLREAAERKTELLSTYLRGTRPPELFLGCYYGGDCDSGQRKGVVQGILADAQRAYAEAIAVLLRNEFYDSDELREMELELLRGVDYIRTMPGEDAPSVFGAVGSAIAGGHLAPVAELASWDLPYFGSASHTASAARQRGLKPFQVGDTYYRGRQSLRRLYAYDVAAARPLVSQANDLVQIADWELLHSNNGNAVEGYELVSAALQRAGVAQASIDEIFLPPTPVVLPAFQPNPLARDETQAATGRIDVAFDITKYGSARAVEILDAANASRDARGRLVTLIMRSRFRPRPTNGEFGTASRVVVRYYLYGDAP